MTKAMQHIHDGQHVAGAPAIARGRAVVEFWREIGAEGWFAKNDEVDRRFREEFTADHFAAARRECDHWLEDAQASLGLILLLDQFPRNAFRGTAHMFATDPLARHYAHLMIERDLIAQLDADLRLFVCLPFVHSEDLADQDRALQLYPQYAPDSLEWAHHHREIIVRFGRFPHRNDSLARATTAAEQTFLDEGGFQG